MENWKSVSGFEGYYEISRSGSVKRIKPGQGTKTGILKQYERKDGYLEIRLCIDGISSLHLVHRLVCVAFKDNTENLPCINHINGVKSDNSE